MPPKFGGARVSDMPKGAHMLPEVQAWFDLDQEFRRDWDQFDQDHAAGAGQIEDIPDEELDEWSRAGVARERAWRRIVQDHRHRRAVALAALSNSSDPLVRFIVTTPRLWEKYPAIAPKLLRELPASREEFIKWFENYTARLEEYLRAGFKDDWDLYVQRADEAGVWRNR